ncbi:MAG: tetratricopeptide repeat protein [Hyphomicrobiales bacterium]|nr:tetratricopeptide repeat protein [Hyphomicrobiales bacterium]
MTSALASRLLQDGLDMPRRGAITAAADRYSQILKFEPKNVDALCLPGVACGELGRSAEAVKFLRKATKVAPKHAAAHNLLGGAPKALDSPWYPATRLFRQSSAGDWPGVFARIADAVRARASAAI